jgi:cytoskeletal protein RodZ
VLQLEGQRRSQGVSLEAISEQTKICTRYLRAIESEEFEKLPGGLYSLTYIRQYARAIGYPEDAIIALHAARNEAASAAEIVEVEPPRRGVLRAFREWLGSPNPLVR